MNVEEKLESLGLALPQAPKPLASYVAAVHTGNLVFTAGQVPARNGMIEFSGQVGNQVSLEEAQKAAQLCALNCLAAIKSVIGSCDKITRIVRLNGLVACAADFTDQPTVVNGASDLLLEVFGEIGKHSRVAVGVAALPRGVPVEIDMVVEVTT